MNAVDKSILSQGIAAIAAQMEAKRAEKAGKEISQNVKSANNVPLKLDMKPLAKTGYETPKSSADFKSELAKALLERNNKAVTTSEPSKVTSKNTEKPKSIEKPVSAEKPVSVDKPVRVDKSASTEKTKSAEKAQITHLRSANSTNAQSTSSSKGDAIEVSEATHNMISRYIKGVEVVIKYANQEGVDTFSFENKPNKMEALHNLKEVVNSLFPKNVHGHVIKEMLLNEINQLQDLGLEITSRVKQGI